MKVLTVKPQMLMEALFLMKKLQCLAFSLLFAGQSGMI